jgi:hypothetical protein
MLEVGHKAVHEQEHVHGEPKVEHQQDQHDDQQPDQRRRRLVGRRVPGGLRRLLSVRLRLLRLPWLLYLHDRILGRWRACSCLAALQESPTSVARPRQLS